MRSSKGHGQQGTTNQDDKNKKQNSRFSDRRFGVKVRHNSPVSSEGEELDLPGEQEQSSFTVARFGQMASEEKENIGLNKLTKQNIVGGKQLDWSAVLQQSPVLRATTMTTPLEEADFMLTQTFIAPV